jgi:hypothetical protein
MPGPTSGLATTDPTRRSIRPMSLPGRVGVAALVTALAVTACGPAAGTRAPDVATTSVARDGVVVSLALEGQPVSGSRSWARVRIANVGAEPIIWGKALCDVPASVTIDLRTAFDPGREWPGLLGRFKVAALNAAAQNPVAGNYVEEGVLARASGNTILCPAGFSSAQLNPRAALEMRAAWDGRVADAPAPPGRAVVSAAFGFMGVAGEVPAGSIDTHPIVAQLAVDVQGDGTGSRLAPGLAIDAALADPEFSAFVLASPEATWVNPDVAVIEGNWWIGLFRRRLDDPTVILRGEVMIDPAGQVVGHRFE